MTTPGGQSHTQRIDASVSPIDHAVRAPVGEGEIIAGRYRVERVLGVGGMGVVVAAMHLGLDQRVAIKFVLPLATKDDALLERFLREARAVARLRSEHVTKVLDVGKLETGAPYMVMELLDGCDLAALIAKHGPLPVDTAADYIAQACEAVAEAHTQGIIHRDIKPQNLFLTTSVGGAPLVKVLDFGVSKVCIAGVQTLTQSMMVVGSPLYMSPEQMRSARDVDPRSDVWSLGVVLFELLTGRVPFDADSMPALCLKVVGDDMPRLDRHRNDVPPELAAIVLRCLAKDPERRYRDAAELGAALTRFVSMRPMPLPVAAETMSVTIASPRQKTRTMVALLAAFVVTTLAAFLGGVAIHRVRADGLERARSSAPLASAPLPAPSVIPQAPPAVATAAPITSSSASAAPSATSPPMPSAPKPTAPRTPPKPVPNDDDIPSMR